MAEGHKTSLDEEVWDKPVCEWTVQDVCCWLHTGPLQDGVGLVQAAFTHSINGRALLRLTDENLQRMGVHRQDLRRVILLEVLELRLQQELQQLLYITMD
ncbi:sterile alpha motif domain-containing protein 12-like [Spea bombifrons]|uniref:sterile alpha motif domain-containing protein 12-like n=1 Tax=Spea bombifrons TaxID=233779 RepID=UPI00234AEAAC|nr:sterile alpha motif domain-containing protein 12-like [Spea bombifrons]